MPLDEYWSKVVTELKADLITTLHTDKRYVISIRDVRSKKKPGYCDGCGLLLAPGFSLCDCCEHELLNRERDE